MPLDRRMRCNRFGNHAEEFLQAKYASGPPELNLYSERGGIYAETRSDLLDTCFACRSSRHRIRP
jgi:hypothetical protein